MITVEPPLVQPSLGLIAFMHGVATGKGGYRPEIKQGNTDFDYYEILIRRLLLGNNVLIKYEHFQTGGIITAVGKQNTLRNKSFPLLMVKSTN